MSVNLIDTPEDQEQRERFKIESKDQAIWALRKIAQAKANQDENTQAADDPKLKTVKLPHGSLKMRKQQPEFQYDETQLLPWAKENLPEAVVVKESVAKTPVKKHIQETGEMVPGVQMVERPEKFSVEVV